MLTGSFVRTTSHVETLALLGIHLQSVVVRRQNRRILNVFKPARSKAGSGGGCQ